MDICNVSGCIEPQTKSQVKCKAHWAAYMRECETLLEAQGGLCAICRQPEVQIHYKTRVPKNLAVDHDHANGAVRGLLCGGCNNLLGAANDELDRLQAAIEYLRLR